ncbi:arsenate reductase ArsC [Microbulbifer sp. SAOS-129_SWC]|uniref:arsenate reductase ArsC n=1 Tax=Microbulbifer sp. SAOS-129_SWC TaxID=3145235 RepID=UPI003216529E
MKLLFICTHNRCRSILSEAITNHLAGTRIRAFSAGSQPAGAVHPQTLQHLQARAIPTDGLASKSWDTLQEVNPDAVITVCDSAAGETCPLWLGQSVRVHWGLPDPSKLEGAEAEAAFAAVMDTIAARTRALLAANVDQLRGAELQQALDKIAGEVQ